MTRNFLFTYPRKLAGPILSLIERHQDGETIDQGLVKKVVDSFVSLGIDESDLNEASLGIGLVHRREFRVGLSQEDRVERYLHTTTRKLLITECEHVLVHAHAELMWENFQSLLGYYKDERHARRGHRLLFLAVTVPYYGGHDPWNGR
jgi:cullin 1